MTESSPSPRRRRRRARRAGPAEQPPAEQPPAGQPGPAGAAGSPGAFSSAEAGGPAADQSSAAGAAAGRPSRPASPTGQAKSRRRAAGRSGDGGQSKDTDRGWRELLGNAPSQVGVSGAMRARDLARPGPDDLAAAERELTIVRRQWTPPEETG